MSVLGELKGLIIDRPWIDLILAGEKTWEMRARATKHRGLVALVRKGSGEVVGAAQLIDTRACNLADYRKFEQFHRVPGTDQRAAVANWPVAWILSSVRKLELPVSYEHKRGAQSQICLSPAESDLVRKRYDAAKDIFVREVRLTQSSLRNYYFPLADALDLFPQEAIGGPNKEAAAREITVTFSYRASVSTDIDGVKKMLRERAAIKEFYEKVKPKAGDVIRIEKLGSHSFNFELQRS
ncbi:ASCH domain-containing protein [Bradyrhizobium sp. 160]|uniref:ASCH domain-containing protein n=1 Tax=Bradyrhizobium sp. 160 TaxID=2782634 RepID=UPI001FF8F3F5|nr:ASCH domain-containing protein [Bradyrhizobium sp. 160]MCK1625403.1 ASCH domain-containing protein [Bradyrhizobium sp. 160]